MSPKESHSGFYRGIYVAPFLLWLITILGGIFLRPPTAPIELESLASAWHMWVEGNWHVLRNGQEISDAPPLLHWLIVIGWHVFGPIIEWPRFLSALASLLGLILVGPLAQILWPRWPLVSHFARLILSGMAGFVIAATLIQPEIMSLPLIAGAMLLQSYIWQRRNKKCGWHWLGLGILLALLALLLGWYMPLALILTAAIAPLYGRNSKEEMRTTPYYLALGTTIILAFTPTLIWLGGRDIFSYGNFWLNRTDEATRTETWTLLLLPIMLFPWIVWQTLYRALGLHLSRRWGAGFGLSLTFLFAIFCACLATGNQLQGMLPATIPLTVIGARLLSRVQVKPKDFHGALPGLLALLIGLIFFLFNIIPTAHLDAVWREIFGLSLPIWLGGISLYSGLLLLSGGLILAQISPSHQLARTLQVGCISVLLMTSLNMEFPVNLNRFFDLSPVGTRLSDFQKAGRAIAVYGPYFGEFDFSGKLLVAPDTLPNKEAALAWAKNHPQGAILSYFYGSPFRLPGSPYYRGVARDRWVAIWSAKMVLESDGNVLGNRF